MTVAATIAHLDALVARAATYQVLASGFAPPAPRQRAAMETVAADLATRGAPGAHLRRELEPVLRARARADDRALGTEHSRLFAGMLACPPFESAFEPEPFRKQHVLADVAGFQLAFGFELPDHSGAQVDHVGVELELCALLLQREAFALSVDPERAEICDRALAAFLEDHVGRWVFAFADRLLQEAREGFYRVLAGAVARFVRIEIEAMHLQPEPVGRPPLPVEEPEMRCGDVGAP